MLFENTSLILFVDLLGLVPGWVVLTRDLALDVKDGYLPGSIE
jgi:hypothetical protein